MKFIDNIVDKIVTSTVAACERELKAEYELVEVDVFHTSLKDADGTLIDIGDHIEDLNGKYMGVIKAVEYDDAGAHIEYRAPGGFYHYNSTCKPDTIRHVSFPCFEEIIMQALEEQANYDQHNASIKRMNPRTNKIETISNIAPQRDIAKKYAEYIRNELDITAA